MSKISLVKSDKNCDSQLRELFSFLSDALIKTDEQRDESLKNLNILMWGGTYFKSSIELHKRNINLSQSIVERVGVHSATIFEIKELAIKSFVVAISVDQDINFAAFKSNYYSLLEEYLDTKYSYVGPCDTFRFEGEATKLISKLVSVQKAEDFLRA